MFRNRNFLMGLGIGLAAGALLLQLMIIGGEQENAIDDIIDSDALYTQAELDAQLAAVEERVRAELQAAKPAEPASDEQAKPDDEPDSGTAAHSEAPAEKAKGPGAQPESVVVEKLPVRVKPGMKLNEIAELLHSKGVIKDKKVFLVLMSDISAEIEAGFYFFDGELSPADVKTIITSPPFAY